VLAGEKIWAFFFFVWDDDWWLLVGGCIEIFPLMGEGIEHLMILST